MATYKVIQDIEAEDKLLGPLTLRQFIYAAIVVVMGFISFKLIAVNWLLVLPFIPPMLFFGLLAAPFGTDQSSEVWLLAKIRFFLKPRRRIWDQDGIQELVTITVPKKVEKVFTDNLSQTEVKSRLKALANTLDSRGWAVKNVSVNMFSNPSYLTNSQNDSDRLIDVSSLPHDVPSYEIGATDDILDESSNPATQQLDAMMQQSEQSHRQNMMSHAQPAKSTDDSGQQADYWFLNNQPVIPPGAATFGNSSVVAPGSNDVDDSTVPTREEAELVERMHHEKAQPNPAYSHLKTLKPIDNQSSAAANANDQNRGAGTSGDSLNPDILRLAGNDDLNVATIAREANRKKRPQDGDDEVVISLR